MMHRKSCLLAAILCSLASLPALAQDSLAAQWTMLWNAKKLDSVMQLYAPEPAFLPAVGPRWAGADTIRKNFADLLARYNPHLHLQRVRSETSGSLGYESGAFDETIDPVDGSKPISAKGGYLFVFQRQSDGTWKILEQSWTTEEPPPKL